MVQKQGKIQFRCRQCGKCCKAFVADGKTYDYIAVSMDEIQAIADHLKLTCAETFKKYMLPGMGMNFRMRHIDGACIFLKDNKCEIQDVKPSKCATWPFWPQVLEDKDPGKKEYITRCPGIRILE